MSRENSKSRSPSPSPSVLLKQWISPELIQEGSPSYSNSKCEPMPHGFDSFWDSVWAELEQGSSLPLAASTTSADWLDFPLTLDEDWASKPTILWYPPSNGELYQGALQHGINAEAIEATSMDDQAYLYSPSNDLDDDEYFIERDPNVIRYPQTSLDDNHKEIPIPDLPQNYLSNLVKQHVQETYETISPPKHHTSLLENVPTTSRSGRVIKPTQVAITARQSQQMEKERKAVKRPVREREREDTLSSGGVSTPGPSTSRGTGPMKSIRGKVGRPNIPILTPLKPLPTVQFHESESSKKWGKATPLSPERGAAENLFSPKSTYAGLLLQDYQGHKLKLKIRPPAHPLGSNG